MPRELICPNCGAYLPLDDPEADASENTEGLDPGRTVEAVIPATLSLSDHPLDPSFRAGFTLATPTMAPEEVAQFVASDTLGSGETSTEPSRNGSSETDHAAPVFPGEEPSLEINGSIFPSFVATEQQAPSDPLAISTEPPVAVQHAGLARPVTAGPATPDQEVEESGPGMGFILLASWASAMTLACGWLLWQARHRDTAAGTDTLPVDSRPDDRSSRLTVIPQDHTTTLGKPLRVGDLELTPLRATLGAVTLEAPKPNGGRETKPGGEGSVLLTLSLKNLSANSTFAPIEPAFLRTPDSGAPASFIEGKSGSIDLYPLAESSEWRIVGQELRALKPGESMQTLIASEPTPARDLAGTLRLRLRLHPGASSTSVVHIDIDGDSLQ